MRLIARLDVKGPNVVKGIRMEGLRVVGKPPELARKYAEGGPDNGGACELLFIDTVASLYGRNQLDDLIERTTCETFIPLTIGGGIKSFKEAIHILRIGADKIAINTEALKRPQIINEISQSLGSQALVVSIQAKRKDGKWIAYSDCGRNPSQYNAVEWAIEAQYRGAGEILLTSVDMDGTRKGFDTDLIKAVAPHLNIPLTVGGGCGSIQDVKEALKAGADAIAVASVLHYNQLTIKEIRDGLTQSELSTKENCRT